MIKNKYLVKVTNPQVQKLKLHRMELSTEVCELSRDLLFIKQLLQNKQNDLREVNTTLAKKSVRGPFFSVVPSNKVPSNKDTQKKVGSSVKKENKSTLKCLNGGKSQILSSIVS